MRLYNTMTRRKEEFAPRTPGKVGFYLCGPTVYNHIHIGNARTFLSFDVIRRYFIYKGYDVTFVQNITDVDDKIINRANEEGKAPAEIAAHYTEAFIESMQALGVLDPTLRPRATEEIDSMVGLVSRLVENGHAYESDGDVYFSVRSYRPYGKLSGRDIEQLMCGARVEVDPRKRDPLDFALWKAAKPGEPSWPSPWGDGRPGWHIECSAMSARYLGNPFDIHAGGDDLVFPHHENEIAQSEACFGTVFANYWLHGGMLTIDREKMSKSDNNFLLLKDVLAQVRPAALRMLMLQTHYRSPFDYSTERLDEATAALERVEGAVRNLRWAQAQAQAQSQGQAQAHEAGAAKGGTAARTTADDTAACLRAQVARAREQFVASMDDDFNTASAVAGVYDLVSAGNVALSEGVGAAELASAVALAADTIEELVGVLGIKLECSCVASGGDGLPSEIIELSARLAGCACATPAEALDALMAERQDARTAKDWSRADAVRDGLAVLGLAIEDTPQGPRLIRVGSV
ncbi:MAG: cysteine--tRNA ligase [Coriobacteriales bacterium]|jgi:cysteinyl-tRNA synthetase|nr:cysteine--tRNA ligase [Coriobacteriales bacterium]